MAPAKILLVDDDVVVRLTLSKVLEHNGFTVTIASNVPEALKHISSESFDILLSDLQMPGAGDGLTVVSAMRHANPRAVTFLLSAFPDVDAAAQAILQQADEVLVKPMDVVALVDVIRKRMVSGPARTRKIETVAMILENNSQALIQDWIGYVDKEETLQTVPLSHEVRSAHLPQVLHDLVVRLRSFQPLGSKELISDAAIKHGQDRRKQGYTAPMMVEESRMLQVCIFQTLQNNLGSIDFGSLLTEVMTIADEVDSQLSQAMESYIARSVVDGLPA